jgi:5-methyltetrahydrofolate--homocysteine methyltransferase
MSRFLDLVNERVVVYDGAFGTYVQELGLTADDFGGPELEGCNEILCVTRPEVIAKMHEGMFNAGADVVETASFGSFAVPLGEYNIADRAYELSLAAARIAKEVAADHGKFAAGSIGPGTKAPSLGQISFAELRDAYEEMCRGLIEGGVDVLITETHFDLLAIKASIIGARRAMAAVGREVPIQAQVTMEQTGTMLLGTEIGAALAALDAMKPDIMGINCATGPSEMHEHIRHLSQHARMPISVLPNMGLPSVVDGKMHYDLTTEEFVDYHKRFVTELGVNVVGGCCGSTMDDIRALADAVKDLTPAERSPQHEDGATSIFNMVPFHQDASFLIIGERTNANGSKKFRESMLEADWDTCVKMARDQEKEGAHVLDLCVDYVGRDGTEDMDELASRFATQVTLPVVLDSTEPQVMEAGLQRFGGRCLLNSANLEDGEGEGSRFDRVCKLAKEYGAAVICLLIDEEGQARDVEWKLRIAHRIHKLATERYGLEPGDLIFDALTFPLTTGDDDLRRDGINTIEAIRRIKEELPGVYTTLGISNISFGVNPAARHALNSVFLHECVQAGMDSAIVHAARIQPLNKLPEEQRKVCLDLVWDRRNEAAGYDPLAAMLDVPVVSNLIDLQLSDGTLVLKREIEDGHQSVQVTLPVILCALSGLPDPRSPSLKGIMASRKKQTDVKTGTDIGVDAGSLPSRVSWGDLFIEEQDAQGIIVVDEDLDQGVDQLVAFLEERKLI